ncbi:hypothetical protein ACSRBG_24995, partial [Salmonella enterica]|uniref:hypothetical protein n=1 Tax=Salmonella enterica TaxID=28901 RepID=UPI003EDC2C18
RFVADGEGRIAGLALGLLVFGSYLFHLGEVPLGVLGQEKDELIHVDFPEGIHRHGGAVEHAFAVGQAPEHLLALVQLPAQG